MRGAQRPQTAPRCAPLPPSMGAVWALRAAAAPSTQLQENTMVRLYFYCLSDVFECKLFWSGLFWIVSSTQWCVCSVSGRSSAYGDTTVEGHPAGPGSVSSSTGAISTTTAQHEGDGSEGEGETEGDIHTSNRSDYMIEHLSPTINYKIK